MVLSGMTYLVGIWGSCENCTSLIMLNVLYYCIVSFIMADDKLIIIIGISRYGEVILIKRKPGRVAQSVGHLTRKSGVLGSIPGLATYFRFSFRFFKKGSCQLLAKVCAPSTG